MHGRWSKSSIFYIYGVEVEQKLIDGTRTLYIAEWQTFDF